MVPLAVLIAVRLEVKSKVIGETVLNHLKGINEVAYLRFASVYKEFSDVTDFEKEAAEFN